MKLIGIYCIRNLINGKCYVGRSIDIIERFRSHKRMYDNCSIHHAIAKYSVGNFAFEILELCSEEILDTRESQWIATLNSISPHGYNETSGGIHGQQSIETRRKRSESLMGHPVSDYVKQRVSEANKGRKHTLETRLRWSEQRKGQKAWNKGKKCPQISKALRGKAPHNKGKKVSKEVSLRISQKRLGINPIRLHILVNLCIRGGWTQRRIAESFGVSKGTVGFYKDLSHITERGDYGNDT